MWGTANNNKDYQQTLFPDGTVHGCTVTKMKNFVRILPLENTYYPLSGTLKKNRIERRYLGRWAGKIVYPNYLYILPRSSIRPSSVLCT